MDNHKQPIPNDQIRLYRQLIKEHGKIAVHEQTEKHIKKLGRPKKFNVQTHRKTIRFPDDLMQNIEWNQRDSENFTDCILRLVELGLRMDSFMDNNQDLFKQF